MTAISSSSFPSLLISTSLGQTKFTKLKFFNFQFNTKPISSFPIFHCNPLNSKLFTAISSQSFVSTECIEPSEPELETDSHGEKFDWYAQCCPIMPVCDLDKRVPNAKKVMGIDVVVWWDRNDNAWKVFDDMCPHRLAPLSEGRIDKWGRLPCVYHGWCFNGSGDCKFIPQAPIDGPPVHASTKACVGIYPSTVHHDIIWFWPNTDSRYEDIIVKKKPPYIPELDDPSFSVQMSVRDMPYGYELLVENFMDPAHIDYAHYGMFPNRENKEKKDEEGGRPLDMEVKKIDINGFVGKLDGFPGNADSCKFIAPFIFYAYNDSVVDQSKKQKRDSSVFICVPISPGKSRSIFISARNFGIFIEKIFPRWIYHLGGNLVLDAELYLLHLEERKIMEVGPKNWQKACFAPTKSDALVVGFRRCINKYSDSQVDWRCKYSGALPLTSPREQLMDRYWSHVVNCSSCSAAHKGLNVLEVILQLMSPLSIGIAVATKQSAAKTTLVTVGIVCFAAAKLLADFIYKYFHYHGYDHAFR